MILILSLIRAFSQINILSNLSFYFFEIKFQEIVIISFFKSYHISPYRLSPMIFEAVRKEFYQKQLNEKSCLNDFYSEQSNARDLITFMIFVNCLQDSNNCI